MRVERYGSTSLLVSRISYGTGLTGPLRYKRTPAEGGRLFRYAHERGVNFWDTADGYRTHPHVAEGLQGLDRASVVINTKTGSKDYSLALADVERFLRELRTEYIDIVLLHGVEKLEDFKSRRGALDALLEAKSRGWVRAVGLSSHLATGPIIEEVARSTEIEVLLTLYNPTGLMLHSGTIAEHSRLLEAVYRAGKGICLMKVLADGALAGSAEEAIRQAVAFPYAHSATIGFRDEHQIDMAVQDRAR